MDTMRNEQTKIFLYNRGQKYWNRIHEHELRKATVQIKITFSDTEDLLLLATNVIALDLKFRIETLFEKLAFIGWYGDAN